MTEREYVEHIRKAAEAYVESVEADFGSYGAAPPLPSEHGQRLKFTSRL